MNTININNLVKIMVIWFASLSCFAVGLYIAVNHTNEILADYNYVFGPIGDEGTDAAKFTYPFLTNKQPLSTIFQPFADHRVVLARIQEVYDFVYTQGIQTIQPFRLALLVNLQAFLFIFFIIAINSSLNRPTKFLLTGTSLTLTFAGISLANYNATMMVTWPYIIVFSLISFIATQKYCETVQNGQSTIKEICYLFITFLFVTLSVLTFNIGLILWPIIFIVLIKQKCFKKHWYLWCTALLTYPIYFYNWIPAQGRTGLDLFWKHPIDVFLYMSRILSLPLVASAAKNASIATVTIALIILVSSLIYIVSLLNKNKWSTTEGILFPYYLFGVLTICTISAMRFWMSAEAAYIGDRFTTPSFIIISCLLVSLFTNNHPSSENRETIRVLPYVVTMAWLLSWFIPSDRDPINMNDPGARNQLLMSQAINPIDSGFIEGTRDLHNLYDISMLNYLNDTQKKYKKGVYAFWSAQHLNSTINHLNYEIINCTATTKVEIGKDLRKFNNPGLFLNVILQNPSPQLKNDWQILFTDSNNIIIGFGLPGVAYDSLINRFRRDYTPHIRYNGVINTTTLKPSSTIISWIGDNKSKKICKLSTIVA